MALSTVSGILTRIGLGRLGRLGLEPVVRYECSRPGELLHIDVKKLGRIQVPGHRITGNRRQRARRLHPTHSGPKISTAAWEFVHVCIDDATRLAYVEVLDDEKGITAVGFLRRALAFYAAHGITVEQLLTDNGGAYRSTVHAIACHALGIKHIRTRPYRPQTNGKAEKSIRTLIAGWAYGALYRNSNERTAALPGWLERYNWRRPHGALSHKPPGTRLHELNKLLGSYGLAVRLPDGTVTDLELPFSLISSVRVAGDSSVVLVAGTPTAELSVSLAVLGDAAAVKSLVTVRPARDLGELGVDSGYVSVPEPIAFPSERGRTAYGLLYAPANPACVAPRGELSPLLVVIHGGPTGAARPQLQLGIQYWTTRGFAVVDVNYGGSTGYGRTYRGLLEGAWGVVDVADCLAAARWLAEQGRVDPTRLCIRGGSAGGFTTLAALAREDTPFAAGADHFGVADLEALARETHKFESRYLDSLVGPYPQARDVYRQRSPIHHVDAFSRPLIVLQGSEDEVVPPDQSEMIVEALRAKGVPVAYLVFEGEQHGFRRAENIRRALDAELSFYAQILGFKLPAAEAIHQVTIENRSSSNTSCLTDAHCRPRHRQPRRRTHERQ